MARFPLDTLPVAMQQAIRDAEYVTSHGLLSNPVMMVSPSAQEILDEFRQHRLALRRMCYDILQQMPRWDWDDYFRRIQARGYRYFRQYDSAGHQRGYTIFYGNAAIPASEIARGLTYGKIEATWRSLHPESQQRSYADHPIQKPRPSFHANHVRYTLPISNNSYAAIE